MNPRERRGAGPGGAGGRDGFGGMRAAVCGAAALAARTGRATMQGRLR